MIKYLLSSPQFINTAVIGYKEGVLALIDVSDTDMRNEHRVWLFSNCPVLESDLPILAAAFKNATIVQDQFEPTLEDFLRVYDYNRNTHLLPPIWAKMNSLEKVQAYQQGDEYRKYCERNKSWYKPKIPSGWLREKQYLNNWKYL